MSALIQYKAYQAANTVRPTQAVKFGHQPLPRKAEDRLVIRLNRSLPAAQIERVGKKGLSLGREADVKVGYVDNHTDVQDQSVSALHAQVCIQGNYLAIHDLHSLNGTRISVNGILDQATPVRPEHNWVWVFPNQKIHIGNGVYVVNENKGLEVYTPYAMQLAKLFPTGIPNLQIQQQNTGDCYLLASLYAMSRHPKGERVIARMISPVLHTPDGEVLSWEVNFPGVQPISVNLSEVFGQQVGSEFKQTANAPLGIRVLERAYGRARLIKHAASLAKLAAGGVNVGNVVQAKTMAAVEGGLGHLTLGEFTGWKEFCIRNEKAGGTKGEFMAQLRYLGRHPNDFIITANTPTDEYSRFTRIGANGQEEHFRDFGGRFITQHAYAIMNVDGARGTVDVVNPHNTTQVHTLSFEQCYDTFASLLYVKVPKQPND